MNDLITVGEAADRLRVSDTTIRRLVRAGSIPAFHVGSQVRISQAELDAAIRAPKSTDASAEK